MTAVDLDLVLAFDAAAKANRWDLTGRDRDAYYRTAAPAMARALQELRELACRIVNAGGRGFIYGEANELIVAVLRVTAPPDETDGGET